jgi:hypothetical protein
MYHYIKEQETMKKTITLDWPILPGSVSTAQSQCGTEGCRCKHKTAPRLHGTYYRWTGFIDGKRTTRTISKAAAKECRLRIKNYRKFQKDLNTLLAQALNQAPWLLPK